MSHVIVADLGYGDSGKGTVVDWLCSPGSPGARYRTVVRFNGGAQAGHNVVTPDWRHHTFAQFGSGMFHPGTRTWLSRYVLADPLALAAEAAHLAAAGVPDALDRIAVDRDARLVTPWHRAANRARELARGADRHGSCGSGIGETASYALDFPADAPVAGDCAEPRRLAAKLALLRDRLTAELGPLDDLDSSLRGPDPAADLLDAYRAFAERVELTDGDDLVRLLRRESVVFEGAQGVLLDEWHGFHPYTTWSTTTFANALALLSQAGQDAQRLGVIRTYATRHGPGPFVSEDPTLELPEPHNRRGPWQGPFRTGHLDAVALRYAAEVAGGVTAVALTHLDTAALAPLRLCREYELPGGERIDRLVPGRKPDLVGQEKLTRRLLQARPVYASPSPGDWVAVAEEVLAAPVTVVSSGPAFTDKRALVRLD